MLNIVNFVPKATVENVDIRLKYFLKVKLKKKEIFAKCVIENSLFMVYSKIKIYKLKRKHVNY